MYSSYLLYYQISRNFILFAQLVNYLRYIFHFHFIKSFRLHFDHYLQQRESWWKKKYNNYFLKLSFKRSFTFMLLLAKISTEKLSGYFFIMLTIQFLSAFKR